MLTFLNRDVQEILEKGLKRKMMGLYLAPKDEASTPDALFRPIRSQLVKRMLHLLTW